MISTHVVDGHHHFSYKVLRSLQRENVHSHSVTRQIAPLAGGRVSHSNTRRSLPQPGVWAHLNIFRVFMFYLKELFSRSVMSSSSKTPWTVARQCPVSMRFSRQESWSGLPFPSPEDRPDPRIKLEFLALQADSLPWVTRETLIFIPSIKNLLISSVQFSHSVVSDSLQPHEPQHARPPCPSSTPGVHTNPCPLSW